MPVAVVDRPGDYIYLNRASAVDPVLARVHAGEEVFGSGDGDAVHRLAKKRRVHYDEAIHTRKPVCFEENVEGRHMLWLCAPVVDTDRMVSELIVMGFDVTDMHRKAVAASRSAFVDRISREIQIPLTALIGLVSSLAHTLPEEQEKQALEIAQHGKVLIRHLRELLTSIPGEATATHEAGSTQRPAF